MIRLPPRSTQSRSSAASDVYKRQQEDHVRRRFDVDVLAIDLHETRAVLGTERRARHRELALGVVGRHRDQVEEVDGGRLLRLLGADAAVSYTHLTLPTIYSV